MNVRNVPHTMLPRLTAEERSRQRNVVALRWLLNSRVRPRNEDLYERQGLPVFRTRHGRDPQTAAEVEQALNDSPGYRLWSAMNRSAQEMIWIAAGEPVLREAARLEDEAERLAGRPDKLGALHLDPSFEPPQEVAAVDIHLQPGGYALNRSPRDVAAGALYENGGNIYSFGQGVGTVGQQGRGGDPLPGKHPAGLSAAPDAGNRLFRGRRGLRVCGALPGRAGARDRHRCRDAALRARSRRGARRARDLSPDERRRAEISGRPRSIWSSRTTSCTRSAGKPGAG